MCTITDWRVISSTANCVIYSNGLEFCSTKILLSNSFKLLNTAVRPAVKNRSPPNFNYWKTVDFSPILRNWQTIDRTTGKRESECPLSHSGRRSKRDLDADQLDPPKGCGSTGRRIDAWRCQEARWPDKRQTSRTLPAKKRHSHQLRF